MIELSEDPLLQVTVPLLHPLAVNVACALTQIDAELTVITGSGFTFIVTVQFPELAPLESVTLYVKVMLPVAVPGV